MGTIANHQPPPKRAISYAVANQLFAPGLGSLCAGRWLAGLGQLALSLLGCGLVLLWFFREMSAYYGSMFGTFEPVQPTMKWLEAGAILFAVAWLWSLVTSFSLMRQSSDTSAQALKNFAAPPPLKMNPAQIAIAFAAIPNWAQNGSVISRTFQSKDFAAAMKFVNAVAEAAELAWHHPDIDIRWNKVTLALTTHDSGGLTQKDFALAKKADELFQG